MGGRTEPIHNIVFQNVGEEDVNISKNAKKKIKKNIDDVLMSSLGKEKFNFSPHSGLTVKERTPGIYQSNETRTDPVPIFSNQISQKTNYFFGTFFFNKKTVYYLIDIGEELTTVLNIPTIMMNIKKSVIAQIKTI